MGIVNRIAERWLLWKTRRNEYESAELRAYFSKTYGIEVGAYSYGCFDRWRIPPGTVIGRYCSIARSARVLDANHPIASISTHPYLYDPSFGVIERNMVTTTKLLIEDDVWISHNATITPGCKKIGRGAIVGAGAVVTSDVPAYAIVAGVPAKLVRMRFDPETIKLVESSGWWRLDKNDLKKLASTRPDMAFRPASLAVRDENDGRNRFQVMVRPA